MLKQISGESNFKVFNRYAIFDETQNDNKTVYYFSTPICGISQNKILVQKFIFKDQYYLYDGSNGIVKIYNDHMLFRCESSQIVLLWGKEYKFSLSNAGTILRSNNIVIFTTCNGILIKQKTHSEKIKIIIKTNQDYAICNNSKYFAIMKSQFKPLIVLNTLFAENRFRDVFYDVNLNVKKRTNSDEYDIEMYSTDNQAVQLSYEIDLYESKLIQDTTVQSKKIDENNVYGSVCFLGKSQEFGTQILYGKIDDSKIELLDGHRIDSVKLHIPYYVATGNDFQVSTPIKRFCSFMSNWNNRINSSGETISGKRNNGFITFDLTSLLVTSSGEWKNNTGFIVQAKKGSFSVIATADNYYTPQILEIKYLKNEKGEKQK